MPNCSMESNNQPLVGPVPECILRFHNRCSCATSRLENAGASCFNRVSGSFTFPYANSLLLMCRVWHMRLTAWYNNYEVWTLNDTLSSGLRNRKWLLRMSMFPSGGVQPRGGCKDSQPACNKTCPAVGPSPRELLHRYIHGLIIAATYDKKNAFCGEARVLNCV